MKTAVWKRCGDCESGVWISEGNDAIVRNVGRIQTIESCQEGIVVGLQALVIRIMGFETLKKTRNPFNFPKNPDWIGLTHDSENNDSSKQGSRTVGNSDKNRISSAVIVGRVVR